MPRNALDQLILYLLWIKFFKSYIFMILIRNFLFLILGNMPNTLEYLNDFWIKQCGNIAASLTYSAAYVLFLL